MSPWCHLAHRSCVKKLTRGLSFATIFLSFLGLAGCSLIEPDARPPAHAPLPPYNTRSDSSIDCKSHAYVRLGLADYISTRFRSNAPVRMAIIPFSAPANLSFYSNEQPGVGNQLAWAVQQNLLGSGAVPIVEVLNRHDWPGKKEEFFTGNFGAIATARDAGYDLVLVGNLEPMQAAEMLSARTKLIEVESGITVWYGNTFSERSYSTWHNLSEWLGMRDRVPADLGWNHLVDALGICIAEDVIKDKVVPE